ncbi:MAG TPA: lytic transglycosylase domain-containing protein [Nevskia sp.]|nr:lytic transglycosylase domain-containing protein [Nevskia sp.]
MTHAQLLRAIACALAIILLANPAHAGPTGEPEPELRALLVKAFQGGEDFDDRYDADVWLTDMSTRMKRFVPKALPQEGKRLEFLRAVHAEATKVGVSPGLVLAVINVESGFNRLAISRSGAFGYMQIMPFWLTEIGQGGDNPFESRTNLRMGCVILGYYLKVEHNNYVRALARYNGSYGKPNYPALVLSRYNKRWFPN